MAGIRYIRLKDGKWTREFAILKIYHQKQSFRELKCVFLYMNYVVRKNNQIVSFETVDYLKSTHRKPRKNNCINMQCALNPLRLIILRCILKIKPWVKNQIKFSHQKPSYLFFQSCGLITSKFFTKYTLLKKNSCVDPNNIFFLVVVYYCTLFGYNNLIIEPPT